MKIIKIIAYVILIGCLPVTSFAMGFELTSTAFQKNKMIPKKHTCQGQNISPNLSWKNAPQNTMSFALIMNDPDAPTGNRIHWLVYNLPSNITGLEQNASLPIEAANGLNTGNKLGYSGPCPPNGTHRDLFRLYALDTVLPLLDTPRYHDLLDAMQSHMLGQAVLIGRYGK